MSRKFISYLTVFLFLPSLLFSEVKIIERCGKGALIEKGGKEILILEGSPYEIGYQHGKILKEKIKKMVDTTLMIIYARKENDIKEVWRRTEKFIPERYKKEMEGLSAGSGIPLEKIQLANNFPALFHCSGILLKGKVTKDNKMYHIRILDYMTEVGLQDNAITMVFKPENCNSFITAGFAGFLGTVTGMNEKKIAIGEMGAGGYGKWDGVPMPLLIRMALEKTNTLQDAIGIFESNPRTCEYYYLISDGKIKDGRGIYATDEKFDVYAPGQNHELLPAPFLPDTILITGKKRYPVLRKRVEENYGKIDLQTVMDIIKKPVSMKSNLHNAIFIPEELKMHLAVANKSYNPDFQACYQKYFEYDLKELLEIKLAEEKELKSIAEIPHLNYPELPSETVKGVLKANEIRNFSSLDYDEHKEYLEFFNVEKRDIRFTLKHKYRGSHFDVFALTFPSLVKTGFKENDIVYADYYRSFNENGKPAVILLDILAGSKLIPRLLAYKLALKGINSCFVKLPSYGERKIEEKDLLSDLTLIPKMVIQGVNDIRVVASWLSKRKENSDKVDIVGVSLGAFSAALVAGIDGNFRRACFILGGGQILPAIMKEKKISDILQSLGISSEMLKILILPFEPQSYVRRMENTEVLMINVENDDEIPKESTLSYYNALAKKKIIWFPGKHLDLAVRGLEALEKVTRFLQQSSL